MIRLIITALLIMANISYADEYNSGLSYGKSLLGDLGKVSINPNDVPGFKGIDNKGLDNADEINRQSLLASQSEEGQFLKQQFNREHKIILSDKDELLVSADKLTKNPLRSLSDEFNGEVANSQTAATRLVKCEESGNPYLISCKYKLNAVPYYGERDCEEQHEKSVESCIKKLQITPIYDTKICQQKGSPIIRKVIKTLQEKTHEKISSPIIERVHKQKIKQIKQRYQPYRMRGKPFWTNDTVPLKQEIQDGEKWVTQRVGMSFRRKKVPNYKSIDVWGWENQIVGHELRHPLVVVSNAEYRETPIFSDVEVLHKSSSHRAVTERRVIRWDRVLTKSKTVHVDDSILHWVGGDVSVPGAVCTKQSERCIDNNDRTYYGVKISKPCWKKEITYSCEFPSKNDCQALRNNGCSQSSGKCLKYHDGVCVNYQNTMQCFNRFNESWVGCESFANRNSCSVIREECTSGRDTKVIAGRDVTRNCFEKKISHECSYPSLNNCEQLRLPSCKQIKKRCLKTVNDICVVMGRTYKCVDGVDDSYETNCHDLEAKAMNGICERVSHKAEPQAKKSIAGFEHSAIWSRTSVFKCLYRSKNNCSILKARGCLEKSKKCIKAVSDTCVVWEKTFECGLIVNKSKHIKGAPKCLDGSCRGEDDVNDSNIGDAVTRLAVLQEVGKQSNGSPATKSIFGGTRHECRYNPVGIRNCCKLKGWGNTIGLTSCSPEEQQLSHLRSKGFCVPTGKYCKTKVLGGCLDKRYTFCCYKGAMPKVFQVAAHGQLGISWDFGKHPNCRGLSVKEIQKVKLGDNDVKEIADSMSTKINMPDVRKMQQSISSQMVMAKQKGGYVKEPPKAGERI